MFSETDTFQSSQEQHLFLNNVVSSNWKLFSVTFQLINVFSKLKVLISSAFPP